MIIYVKIKLVFWKQSIVNCFLKIFDFTVSGLLPGSILVIVPHFEPWIWYCWSFFNDKFINISSLEYLTVCVKNRVKKHFFFFFFWSFYLFGWKSILFSKICVWWWFWLNFIWYWKSRRLVIHGWWL